MVDDDMDMSALPKTNYIKSIVTSECKMDMERKGVQSYQSQLYVRFLCFGNGALTALHDRSDGFFRRQIVLTTKDKPAGRTDDPFLSDKLIAEREGIFLWCLEGLRPPAGKQLPFHHQRPGQREYRCCGQRGQQHRGLFDLNRLCPAQGRRRGRHP